MGRAVRNEWPLGRQPQGPGRWGTWPDLIDTEEVTPA